MNQHIYQSKCRWKCHLWNVPQSVQSSMCYHLQAWIHKILECLWHHLTIYQLTLSYVTVCYLTSFIFPGETYKFKDHTLVHAQQTKPFITSFAERPLIHNADLTYNKFPHEDTDWCMGCMVKEMMWGKQSLWKETHIPIILLDPQITTQRTYTYYSMRSADHKKRTK